MIGNNILIDDDITELELTHDKFGIGSEEYQTKMLAIMQKYGFEHRISSKGIKIMESTLDEFWRGIQLSEKQLTRLLILGTAYNSLQEKRYTRHFLSEVEHELISKFGCDEEGLKTVNLTLHFLENGWIEDNPNYLPEIQQIIIKEVTKQ